MERTIDAADFAQQRSYNDSQRARAARINGRVPSFHFTESGRHDAPDATSPLASNGAAVVSARMAGAMCPPAAAPIEPHGAEELNGERGGNGAADRTRPKRPNAQGAPVAVAPARETHGTMPHAPTGAPHRAPGHARSAGVTRGSSGNVSDSALVCPWKIAYTVSAIGVLLYATAVLCKDAARGPRSGLNGA
jgi:hypothetical protein